MSTAELRSAVLSAVAANYVQRVVDAMHRLGSAGAGTEMLAVRTLNEVLEAMLGQRLDHAPRDQSRIYTLAIRDFILQNPDMSGASRNSLSIALMLYDIDESVAPTERFRVLWKCYEARDDLDHRFHVLSDLLSNDAPGAAAVAVEWARQLPGDQERASRVLSLLRSSLSDDPAAIAFMWELVENGSLDIQHSARNGLAWSFERKPPLTGYLIKDSPPSNASARLGFRIADIVTHLDGKPVCEGDIEELNRRISSDVAVEVTLVRNGKEHRITTRGTRIGYGGQFIRKAD